MDKRLLRRVEKIERALEPEKGECFRFPDGDGGFIEVPGHLTLVDIIALGSARKADEELDETERK